MATAQAQDAHAGPIPTFGPRSERLIDLGHDAAITPYRRAVGNEVDLRYHLGNDIKIWDICRWKARTGATDDLSVVRRWGGVSRHWHNPGTSGKQGYTVLAWAQVAGN